MKRIPLTQGKFALVDDEDFDKVSQHKWSARKTGYVWYAMTNIPTRNTKRRQKLLLMHRFIIKTPTGMETDHKDRDGLNNQKSNLRWATSAQNSANKKRQENNTSGYRGVSWKTQNNKWQAAIQYCRKCLYIGLFDTKEEAAKAYNSKAKELHGEYARINVGVT